MAPSFKLTMRYQRIVVLAIVAFLACVNCAVASSTFYVRGSETATRAVEVNKGELPAKRSLRNRDFDTEERGISVSGIDNVARAIKSKSTTLADSAKIKLWLMKGKSADQALNLLKIGDDLSDVLANPRINVLSKFIAKYNKKNPNKQVTMADVLSARYGESALAKILVSAKKKEATKDLATKLQAEQFAGWLKKEKSADDVFVILKLNVAETQPLATRNLKAWQEYLTEFNRLNPEKKTTMLQTFTKFYDGDRGVAKLVYFSKFVPNSKTMSDKLETALFIKWDQHTWTPKDAAKTVFDLDIDNLGRSVYRKFLEDYEAFYQKKIQ